MLLPRLEKDSEPVNRISGKARIYWAMGRRAESNAALREIEKADSDPPYDIATIHAYRDEVATALSWLDRVYRQQDYFLA